MCALYLARPSNQPSNKLPSNERAAQSKHRDIAFIGCTKVPYVARIDVEGWRGGIVEAAKIGSSHLQIEFDSSGGLTPTSGIEPDVSTSPTPSVTGGKGARDKMIRYYKCISRHPLFHSDLSWLGAENIEGNVILWTIWKNFGYSTKGRTKLSLTSSIISFQLFRFVGENLLILFC